ncbi:alpha-(1,3)-fucosyltransferase C-like [Pecten maximus]|uniref:alpha-(1,3)-fucosyltransferase C-like n=1 Tax=Pecten maximus TaxID=6579 RepID=UPI0014581F5F|nr:alpha-(1,3)-fucosyltransferase C-like [Pecten maximus]
MLMLPMEAQHHFANIRFVCTQTRMKRLFTCILIVMIFLFLYVEHLRYVTKQNVNKYIQRIPKDESLQVFFYNRPRDFSLDVFKHCDFACHMVDTGDYNKSYAVVFHSATLYNQQSLQKQNGHIWIFYTLEPPHRHPSANKLKKWHRLFNWTIGYRRDADILNMYGRFKTLPTERQNEMKQKLNLTGWKDKTEYAAWFVSNCFDNAKREEYVNMVKKIIFVDKFGNCGPMKCPKSQDTECQRMLKEKYKFYMSFESELCRDYITEKSFKLYWDYTNTIPIVRGGSNYSMYLPSHSYISTRSFKSVRELAKRMLVLSKDVTNSTQYFQWQTKYYVDSVAQEPFCELCKKLHDPMKYQRVYDNVNDWLRGSENIEICQKSKDLH